MDQIQQSSQQATDYIPVIFKLKYDKNNDVLKSLSNDLVLNDTVCQPLMSLGFDVTIYQTKNKFEMPYFQRQKDKKYLVTNKFEHIIHGNNKIEQIDDIQHLTSKFYNVNINDVMFNRAFVKLHEMIVMFDLIPLTTQNFTSAHLAESPGSFFQCTVLFRDKFGKNNISKNDNYHCISIYSESSSVPTFSDNMINHYSKETPKRLHIHTTYPLTETMNNNKDNGDLTNPKTILNFIKTLKNKAHFVTADGGFENADENLQEQESFKLIFGEIISAILIQEYNGHFVLKIFETYTLPMIKLLHLLCEFYEEVHIMKPLTSRKSNSEKYVICKNFKFKNADKFKNVLLDMLQTCYDNPKSFIHNLFLKFSISSQLYETITIMNNEIFLRQFVSINEYVSFVKNNKQFTDTYGIYINEQKKAAYYWASVFLIHDKQIISKNLNNTIDFFNNL